MHLYCKFTYKESALKCKALEIICNKMQITGKKLNITEYKIELNANTLKTH